jgi:hypothetical protein
LDGAIVTVIEKTAPGMRKSRARMMPVMAVAASAPRYLVDNLFFIGYPSARVLLQYNGELGNSAFEMRM